MSPLSSLAAVRATLRDGVSPEELLAESARRARLLDGGPRPVHAFLSLVPAGGPGEGASEMDRRRPAGEGPPGDPEADGEARRGLAGVPVAVKDNLCTGELPTTCASRLLEGFRAPYEATAVRRLRAAGARVVGKTNLDEFGMGSSTEHGAYGPTRNPVDRDRVPGGSSGGSAAAVAAGVVPVALGSDTGGSVRQPAALCGVVGLKPTYGRVSRYGLVAFASSLDTVGILARSVDDASEVLGVISGPDPRDASCADRSVPAAGSEVRGAEGGTPGTDGAFAGLAGITLGLPSEYLETDLHPGVRTAVDRALGRAADAGAAVREVSLPTTSDAVPCYYLLAPAEAASNLARFDGLRYGRRAAVEDTLEALVAASRGEGLGREVQRRILVGTYVLSAGHRDRYYLRARAIRRRIREDFRGVFREGVDALFTPTVPEPAFRLGERTGDPWEMYRSDVFTVAASLAGLPALSLPIGNVEGLPVGGQLVCPAWEEERLLSVGRALEARLGYIHPLDDPAVGGPGPVTDPGP